jgi:hypothetical protein
MKQSSFGCVFSTMKINPLKLWDSLHSPQVKFTQTQEN